MASKKELTELANTIKESELSNFHIAFKKSFNSETKP